MKRKPNKPKQEPRERPGSWESAADPGGAAGGGSPGGAGAADSGTSGQSVHNLPILILTRHSGFVCC